MPFGKLNNTIPGDFTRDDFRKVQESQGFLCFWCGTPICENSNDPECEATRDHLLPTSHGGGDFRWNIVAACLRCNRMRNNKLPGPFLRERWAFARIVDETGKKSTVIPLTKKRINPPAIDSDFDDAGNLITEHLEVSPVCGSIIRALSENCRMEPSDHDKRIQLLRDQARRIERQRLEDAGQMQLKFDRSKPVATALLETEAQALVLRGFEVMRQLQNAGHLPTHEQIIQTTTRRKA